MKATTFLAGAAIGYVFGSRAGRERYQQIVDGARALGGSPAVQNAQTTIKGLARQSADAAEMKIDAVTDAVADKLSNGDVPALEAKPPSPRKAAVKSPKVADGVASS